MTDAPLGHVWLVGGGPGDPGLITVAGLEAIRRAEVVVHDRLSPPELLREAPEGALILDAGKSPDNQRMTQDQINAALVEHGRAGKRVVRLKGGDPYVFGRGGEEAMACAEAGVPCTVIPGITSAIGGLAAGGVPVTHRGIATSFTVVTGHEDPTKPEAQVRWDALAHASETLVILMGVERLEGIARALIDAGRDASTPAALVQEATTARQRTVTGTLETIASIARAEGITNPALFVVGAVAALQPFLDPARLAPLAGKRVLVTRSRSQASSLVSALRLEGAHPIELPAIEVQQRVDDDALRDAISQLDASSYRWVVFTSANAVDVFLDALMKQRDLRAFGDTRICAIGPATERVLVNRGLRPDLVPAEAIGEDVARALVEHGGLEGARVLLPRAEQARDVIPDTLRAAGAEVDDLPLYLAAPPAEPPAEALALVREGDIDVVTFTSSSTVRNLAELLGGDLSPLDGATIACIGPASAATAREAGLTVHVTAETHTIEGLVSALRSYLHADRAAVPGGGALVVAVTRLRDFTRTRRTRRTEALRGLVRETRLDPSMFIYPLFVTHGSNVRTEISSMPGQYQLSVDQLAREAGELRELGVRAVLLFGLPASKDPEGTEGYASDGIVQQAIRELKRVDPDLVVIADICLCEYTDHGHCGLLTATGEVDNDPSLELLARMSVSTVEAGADIVAPSDMMDGRVGAIRDALDDAGYASTPIMAYSAKYASAFYGPFREAADSTPQFGDRRGYQMDPANALEALREVDADVEEDADIVMVKPALPYLDVIRAVRERTDLPLAAYNVSGEYAMVKAAVQNGWLDERRVVLETLTGIARAGAGIIITYHAKDAARWLREDRA